MKFNRKLFALLCAVLLLVGAAGGALATTAARQVTATLDPTIGISYNGQKQTMTDANGNPVYPLSYNGTTYVPVRAVSTIFGETVNWDGASRTVQLGTVERQAADLTTRMGAGNEYCWKISDKTELTVPGSEGEATYKTGIHREIWNGSMSSSAYTLVPLDTTGMTTLTFTMWSDIDADILVLTEKSEVIASIKVTAGSIISKEIDITGYSKIAFGANGESGAKGVVKIFEPMVK